MSRSTAMTFIAHLEELRNRIIVSIVAVLIGTGISFYLNRYIVKILKFPLKIDFNNVLASAIDATVGSEGSIMGFVSLLLKARASSVEAELFKEGALEGILALLRISLTFGVILAFPIVIYEIWSFILPALTKKERRYTIPLFFIIFLFFILGGLFAYFIVAPIALRFSASLFPGIENRWMLGRYISFISRLILGFGVAFELPIVMGFLAKIGIIDANGFQERRRYAMVIIFAISALLTPADVLSMLLMAFPLLGLYQLGIWFAVLIGQESENYGAY